MALSLWVNGRFNLLGYNYHCPVAQGTRNPWHYRDTDSKELEQAYSELITRLKLSLSVQFYNRSNLGLFIPSCIYMYIHTRFTCQPLLGGVPHLHTSAGLAPSEIPLCIT